MKKLIYVILAMLLLACGKEQKETSFAIDSASWDEIIKQGQNQSVNLMMWTGDTKINAYMNSYIRPLVKEKYNIDLTISSGQGNTIVQILMAELQANKTESDLDMVWINGETFYQLQQIKGLYGPWTSKLPNAEFIDFDNKFIGMDFQQPIAGYELPWGNVQMTIIYNSENVKTPPMTREALYKFAKENPGKFTWDNHFTGLTFLKALLIDIAGGNGSLNGDFDEKKYQKYSSELWSYLTTLKPYLWKNGETFPEAVAPMHQLFASGELWFTMSNNDAEVDNKIAEGIFPETTRAYVPKYGTIQNSHYMGISKMSINKAAAMVVANEMISAEAQLKKQDPSIWGDGTVLDTKKLPSLLKAKFNNQPNRKYAPKRSEITQRALQEINPEYMIRLAEDFRKYMIK
ncbi:ABC transporter substrate-binding protein [Aquimarina sp. AD10]|uniref:ABC transporter substrate-binding protein n=1 Tax=Aquimarina sp. AD10 TaxID=1714849 RepID=UPI000E492E9A|nr:ABC transporter substrate-binding protein [Aquimarina sp. AD10]AXT62541.1 ABC transporter substrate-binding protein [Aquimarina sp. AD10]RKM90267.1 ABC transporter substrate-binding protein [Aquimarina sp. AD10]